MPRIVIDGDKQSVEAIKLLLHKHPKLTVRDLLPEEEDHADELLGLPDDFVRPAVLPTWCVLPREPFTAESEDRAVSAGHLKLFTDGSSQGNPGPCGMAVVIYDELTLQKGAVGFGWHHPGPHTSNQAELSAFLSALNYTLLRAPERATISTDSKYISGYLEEFTARYRAGGLTEIRNPELWQQVILAMEAARRRGTEVGIEWVRGHNGQLNNERADALAVRARKQQRILRENYKSVDREQVE